MNIYRITLPAALLVGATSLGCASSNEQGRQGVPTMYGNKMDAELQNERQEFITEKQQELREIETEINRLEARIQGEAQYVDAEQRAEWNQELFELKQERQDLQARLSRAQSASPEEWNEMRGFFGKSIDRLEAGVSTLGGQIEQLTGPEGERQPVSGEEGQEQHEYETQEDEFEQ